MYHCVETFRRLGIDFALMDQVLGDSLLGFESFLGGGLEGLRAFEFLIDLLI
jgi:hypothetical protein